ncbi:MAG: HDOD domain-containing protein [Bryobacteraceae bacterium]|nr:HDOD domain-containing protein [Bryobacteraceae bacterium]
MRSTPTLPAIPAGLRTVPAFPPVAARLLTVFSSPNISVRQVADLIASDPVFSARILQCANSAEFARLAEVSDVRQALMLLGLERVRRVTVSLAAATFVRGAGAPEEMRQCWRHTVACGILADAITAACGLFVEFGYTAGLLHDIGRLGLLAAYPKEYGALIRTVAQDGGSLQEAEYRHFGMDHASAGKFLSRRWALPAVFESVAAGHHRAPEGKSLDLLTIVHCACGAADALGFHVVPPQAPPDLELVLSPLPPAAARRLTANPADLRARIESQLSLYEGGREGVAAAMLDPDGEPDDESDPGLLPLDLSLPEPAPRSWWRRLFRR